MTWSGLSRAHQRAGGSLHAGGVYAVQQEGAPGGAFELVPLLFVSIGRMDLNRIEMAVAGLDGPSVRGAATQKFRRLLAGPPQGAAFWRLLRLSKLRRGCERLEGSEDQVESERELVGGVVPGGEERCGGFVQVGVMVRG